MRRMAVIAGLAAALLAAGALALYAPWRAPEPPVAVVEAALPAPAPEPESEPPAAPAAPAPRVFGETALPGETMAGVAVVTEAAGEELAALVVHREGGLALAHGAGAEPVALGQAARSLLSVLYGIAADRGLVDIDASLGALGVEEPVFPLSETEKTATIRDLLMGRSGIYLPGSGAALPARGSAPPGRQFAPTPWETNVLAALFAAATGIAFADAVTAWLAVPLGMEDFDPAHVALAPASGGSAYPALSLRMSPRDLARVGTMMAMGGLWLDRRILSEEWVVASITPWSVTADLPPFAGGYGYSWWIDPKTNAFLAESGDGLYLYADPGAAVSLVLRGASGEGRAELMALADILTRR